MAGALCTAAAGLAQEVAGYVRCGTPRETFEASFVAAERAARDAAPEWGPWYALAPFENAGGKGFDAAYPPEQGVDLAADYLGAGGERIRWARMDGFKDGPVNDLKLYAKNEYVCTYLYREVRAAAACSVRVELGSDDTLTVWLNGERLLAKNVARSCQPGSEKLVRPARICSRQQSSVDM